MDEQTKENTKYTTNVCSRCNRLCGWLNHDHTEMCPEPECGKIRELDPKDFGNQ